MSDHPTPFERALQRVLDSEIPDHILSRSMTASLASSIKTNKFEAVTGSLASFLALTLDHRAGAKEGLAILPGTLKSSGRNEGNVTLLTAVVFDIDHGEEIDNTKHKLEKAGCVYSLHTTHSDGKTVTVIKVADLVLKVGLADESDISTDLLQLYLREHRRCEEAIWSTIAGFTLECDKGGRRLVRVEHAPIRKFRVVIPLEEPFHPGRYRSLAEAKRAWAGCLEAVARALELDFDRACVDLSRAFFLPRHPRGRPFEVHIGGRRLLDLAEIEPVERQDQGERSAAAPLRTSTSQHPIAADPDRRKVARLLGQMGHDLDLIDLLVGQIGWETRGNVRDGKVAILCPNQDLHSNPDDTSDAGCVAMNPDAANYRRAVITCQHTHCRDLQTADFLTMVFQQVEF